MSTCSMVGIRAVKCVKFMFRAGRSTANNSLARDRQWKGFIWGHAGGSGNKDYTTNIILHNSLSWGQQADIL